jgi:class 3 adenylate cyclase
LTNSVENWLDAVRHAGRRGELLSAVDLAEQGLAEHPDEIWLEHAAVLALARAGATGEAARRFERYALEASAEEDVAALGARIAKDLALADSGPARRELAIEARDRYQAIFERTGGYYPAVNAATLSLVADEPERARELARTVLGVVAGDGDGSYYAAASAGEAYLLLGDEAGARAALVRAAALNGGDHGALATTRRQLRLVCELSGIDDGLLAPLAGPGVVHFCGHRIAAGGRFPPEAEAAVGELIEAEVAREPVGYAYGALASGSDILWAEALLRSGAELHVVLPFSEDQFIDASVTAAGPSWVERFRRCIAAATSVNYATDGAYLGDAILFRYGTELAMGLALLRARYLDARVRQLAVWDGGPAVGGAGTAIDVTTWRRSGAQAVVIAPPIGAPPPAQPAPGAGSASSRVVRALLFADVHGYSKLSDEAAARSAEQILGAFARVLDRYDDAVEHRNTWGDALYVVLSSTRAAAECALDLQESMAETGGLELRTAAHVGPVFPIHDPVLGVRAFTGSHVSRTARIEPVTPPGAVYVTEPFAASLELEPGHGLACDYVGHMPAAKDYGRLRMYRLRRRGG